MSQYIVRYRGEGEKPATVVERIRKLPQTRILDEDSPRMLLVETPGPQLQEVLQGDPQWLVSEKRSYRLPEQRPGIAAPPQPARAAQRE